MPSEEQRLRDIENRQNKVETLIEHLNDSLDEIKVTLKEAIDVKGRVENYGGQLNELWRKFDKMVESSLAMAQRLADQERRTRKWEEIEQIILEHKQCMADKAQAKGWIAQRGGNLLDKLLLVAGTALLTYMATH